MNTPWLQKYCPAVLKEWLYLIAGLLWSSAGVMLCWLAYTWLRGSDRNTLLAMGSGGFIAAMAVYTLFLATLANRNIGRIHHMNGERICVFAFQKKSSYILIAAMIALGIFLRTSGLIPRPYLALLYLGMGGGLLIASTHYYRWLLQRDLWTQQRI